MRIGLFTIEDRDASLSPLQKQGVNSEDMCIFFEEKQREDEGTAI